MLRAMMRSLVIACVLVGCGGEDGPRTKTFGGDRPVDLKTPETLTEGKRYPLLVVLHGYGASGFVQTAYFGVGGLPAAGEALLIAPEGTEDGTGKQFWNADARCCDFGGLNPDDVGYIGGIIDDVIAEWPVDKNAVFLLGHSNGGYMSYRMACERADVVTAIASLAGNASSTPAACTPSAKVNVVHLHGTLDATVPYSGAEPSVDQWAQKNGCGTTRTPGSAIDLDSTIDGAETMISTQGGCPANGAVELWRMEGSSHIPVMHSSFSTTIMQWFNAHKRS